MVLNNFHRFTLLLIIFLVSSPDGRSQEQPQKDGYTIFYHSNGQKSSEGLLKNGKPDGYWKTYNESGILVSEGNRKDFQLDSTWIFYDDEGKVKMEINYLKGKKNGIRRTYREDEIVEEMFTADVKNGPTRHLSPEWKIRELVNFKDGLEEGTAYEYDEDGRIITLISYKSGFIISRELINRMDVNNQKHGIWKYFHPNGNVRLEGAYKHGLENGYFKEYDMQGSLLSTSKYENGTKLEDVAELAKLEVRKDYYPDGKVKIAATYNKEGKPEGIRREYAPDGSVERSYIFKNGIMIGEGIVTEKGERDGYWKEYYDNGNLRAEGTYAKDKKTGKWKFYYNTGNVEQEGVYREGKPDGPWFWFYESGKLLREENYFNGLLDGPMVEYDEQEQVITRGEFIEGRPEGEWTYKTAETLVSGNYSEGMRSGLWQYFDIYPMGQQQVLRYEGRFVEDNPNGRHIWYWDNGKKKDEGEYLLGRKTGDWTSYNYDGTTFLIVAYDNGMETRYDGIKITELNGVK
jgi:antitoxin component YwqK of YwqJK toxin-antitoxin module